MKKVTKTLWKLKIILIFAKYKVYNIEIKIYALDKIPLKFVLCAAFDIINQQKISLGLLCLDSKW